jgi:hypothetical protein
MHERIEKEAQTEYKGQSQKKGPVAYPQQLSNAFIKNARAKASLRAKHGNLKKGISTFPE